MYVQEFNIAQSISVLFIHGGGVSGWVWEKQVAALDNFHCIVPDLPGHGGSRTVLQFSIKECAQQIAKMIKAKGHGGKAHVVGHSIGAQILVQLLADSPEVLRSAVINSALVRPMGGVSGLIRPTVKMTIPLTRKKWFAKLQAKALSVPEEYFSRYYEESKFIFAEVLESLLMENSLFKLPSGLANTRVPTLILVGQKERGIMLKSAKDLATVIPNAKGYLVPGVGHGFNLEVPELYNEVLLTWFSESDDSNFWARDLKMRMELQDLL